MSILQLSKKTINEFNEKFDWSKNKQTTDYLDVSQPPSGVLTTESETNLQNEKTIEEESGVNKTFSFDDINF